MNPRKGNLRRPRTAPMRRTLCNALLAAMMACTAPAWAQRNDAPQAYTIPGGDLADALDKLASQSKVQILYPSELVRGKRAVAISGQHTWREVLQRLLEGSGLAWGLVNDTTVVIKQGDAEPKPAVPKKTQTHAAPVSEEEDVTNMPAIMVTGAKTLNMDIVRTEDDPQPYVVFDREQIERSGATSLEQFLQQRLTMNSSIVGDGSSIATSEISLRGLSAAQTLILIDGHRASSPGFSNVGPGGFSQADISGIPLAAIERIEVLPSTASGIYGGSATGGVVNVIMRRDYTGAEIRLTYDNTFSTDTSTHQVDLIAGHSFNKGRTNVLLTVNYSDANDLLVRDRDFMRRGREVIKINNPAWLLPPSIPPLGAMPNIGSLDGSNLTLDNGTPLNAAFTTVPAGYAGPSSDGGVALIANAGRYNWDLTNTAQVGSGGSGGGRALYTRPTVKSGALAVRHEVDESLQIFADLSTSDSETNSQSNTISSIYLLPAASSGNPFAQSIWVSAGLPGGEGKQTTSIERQRALVGLVKRLPRNWYFGADYTWDRTTVIYGGTALGAKPAFRSAVSMGVIDILRDLNVFPMDLSDYTTQSGNTSPFQSTMEDTSVRASGPMGSLPGGAPILSAALAYRDEAIPDSFYSQPATNLTQYYPSRSQSVASAYLEVRLPIFSDKNARPRLHQLDLQIAVRRDDYSSESGEVMNLIGQVPSPLPEALRTKNDFHSINPTIALRWMPSQDLALRGSYGTGFLPPALNQIVPTIQPSLESSGIDPLRGNTLAGPFTRVTGGNPNLTPEHSKSLSAGVILTPRVFPSLRMSIDYTRIKKTDNIGFHPELVQGIIDDESLFPGRVVRGPNLPSDPPGWAGPITLVDTSYLNLARTEIEALDAQVEILKDTDHFGSFDLFFMGTWQPHYRAQVIKGQPIVDKAGIGSSNPLKFKANAGLTWSRASWLVGWNVRHFDSYLVSEDPAYVINQGGEGKVPSQTYHDFFVKYTFGSKSEHASKFPAGSELTLGIRNVFNKIPPLDAANTLGFYSRFGDPRLSSWYLSIVMEF